MSLVGDEFKEKWNRLTSLSYKDQAIWFLNGFWLEVQNDAEKVWKWTNVAVGIDRRKEAGNDLDEFEAHRFLETLGETLTVQAMRNKFREIDIDFNKRMAFIEYLIFKYQKTVKLAVEAPQGDDSKLKKAQALAAEAQVLLDETLRRLEEEKAALAAASRAEREAREAEDVAKNAESQARLTEAAAKQFEAEAVRKENAAVEAEAKAQAAEDAAQAAEDEQKSALAELHAQEQARDNALAALLAKINDAAGTTVSKGRAKQEYEELKGKDPLPLQKAKINQEATVRKFERARKFASDERAKASLARRAAGEARENATDKRKHAEEDRAKAENDRAAAEVAREHAEEQRRAAEASTEAVARAVAEAEAKFAEALAVLEEEKKKPISPFGKIWWLERELEEKKKYLPLHKGGVARK